MNVKQKILMKSHTILIAIRDNAPVTLWHNINILSLIITISKIHNMFIFFYFSCLPRWWRNLLGIEKTRILQWKGIRWDKKTLQKIMRCVLEKSFSVMSTKFGFLAFPMTIYQLSILDFFQLDENFIWINIIRL